MATSRLIIATPNQSQGSPGTTYYWPLANALSKQTYPGEIMTRIVYRTAWTAADLEVNVRSNSSAASTLSVEKNGTSSALSVNIPSSTNGWMTLDTDTVDYNGSTDYGSLKCVIGAGGSGMYVGSIAVSCTVAGAETVAFYHSAGMEGNTSDVFIGSLTQGGAWPSGSPPEAERQNRIGHTCTARNLVARITQTDRTGNAVLTLRKNSTDSSLAVTVPDTAVQGDEFADTGTLALVPGDLLNYEWDLSGTGGSGYTAGACYLEIVSPTSGYVNYFANWGSAPTYAASSTFYFAPSAIHGSQLTATTGLGTRFRNPTTVSGLYCYVPSGENYLSGDTTITVMKNTGSGWVASAVVTTVPGGDDGAWYNSGGTSVDFDTDDEILIRVTTGATGGAPDTIEFSSFALLTQFPTPTTMGGSPAVGAALATTGALQGGVAMSPPPADTFFDLLFAIEVWSNYECASGARTGVVSSLLDGSITESLDNTDELELVVPDDEAYAAGLTTRQVIRVTAADGNITEWRIVSIERASGFVEPALRIRALSPIVELSRTLLRDTAAGALPTFDMSVTDLTLSNIVTGVIVPRLSADGISYFALGTVSGDSTADPLTITWDRWTPLQLINELATRTRTEFRFRRNGSTNYLLDFVEEWGSSGNSTTLELGRNITAISLLLEAQEMATQIVPFGEKVIDDVESSTMAEAVWKITAKATNVLTLADVDGGAAPIQYDDQLNGCYLVRVQDEDDNSQITDTDLTNQQVTVSSGTAFSVGDWVYVAADSNLTPLIELENPASVAAYGDIRAYIEVADERNELNWLMNPALEGATIATEFYRGDVASIGTFSGGQTDVTFNNLPNGLNITAGSWCVVPAEGTTALKNGRMVATGGTVSAGSVTLYFDGDLTGGSTSVAAVFWIHAGFPANWDMWEQSIAYNNIEATLQRALIRDATLSGAVAGNQSNVYVVDCDGFTSGDTVYAGDMVQVGSFYFTAQSKAVADGSGNISLRLHKDGSYGADNNSFTDNDTVTVTHVALPGTSTRSGVGVYFPAQNSDITSTKTLHSDAIELRLNSGSNIWWAHAALVHIQTGSNPLTIGGSHTEPRLKFIDATSFGTIGTSFIDSQVTSLARGFTAETLRCSYQLTADDSVRIALTPWQYAASAAGQIVSQGPGIIVAFMMLTRSVHYDVPFVYGSWGTRLWQHAQKSLKRLSEQRASYVIELQDRAALGEADEDVSLGASHRLVDAGLAVDQTVRVVSRTRSLLAPVMSIELDTQTRELTKAIAGVPSQAGSGWIPPKWND